MLLNFGWVEYGCLDYCMYYDKSVIDYIGGGGYIGILCRVFLVFLGC